jgi:pyrimidine deaminase RibD-like protein
MSGFTEQDRRFLLSASELAEAAQRPPLRLGLRPEPAWAALLATPEKEVLSATFSPGETEDAVKKLIQPLSKTSEGREKLTLYLTLEPKAGFDRLAPVTESVRRLGVKRVVIGTLDPALRLRGEGSSTLERTGIEVVLADGEEARRCQQMLDDYSKWLQKGITVLRAQVELQSVPDGDFDLKFSSDARPLRADAVICRAGDRREVGTAWRVVIDPEGWERPAERTVLYQNPSGTIVPGARPMPLRNGALDLGALLRDLASLGFLTAELSGDSELFRLALRSQLIDSVVASLPPQADSIRALSRMNRVRLAEGGDPLELRLNGARLVDGKKPYLEARVELC